VLQHASAALDDVRRQEFFRAGAVMREHGRGKRWLLLRRWKTVRGSKREELRTLFAANRRLFKAYVLREQLDRLWMYKTRPGVLNFVLGWIGALRWQLRSLSGEQRQSVDLSWGVQVNASESAVVPKYSRKVRTEESVFDGPISDACLQQLRPGERGNDFGLHTRGRPCRKEPHIMNAFVHARTLPREDCERVAVCLQWTPSGHAKSSRHGHLKNLPPTHPKRGPAN
jgi:transposase